jgi:hypothetical protein
MEYQKPIRHTSMKHRDVAGIVGLGDRNALGAQVIGLTEFQTVRGPLVRVFELPQMIGAKGVALFGLPGKAWTFFTTLARVRPYLVFKMRVDLGVEGIIFPLYMEDPFIDYIKRNLNVNAGDIQFKEEKETRRLIVPCEVARELEITLTFVPENLGLRPESLVDAECNSLISFSTSFEAGVIGKVLLRNVRMLMYHYKDGVIGFSPKADPAAMVIPKLLVPHFSEPVFDETSVVFERLHEKGKEGLFLQGFQSQVFHDSIRCWTFVRSVADFTLETTTEIVTETENAIHLVIVDGSIRFPILKTDPVEAGSIVAIKRTPEHVFVCQDLTQAEDIGPCPECCICLEPMPNTSDMAQTKCPWCKNKFHRQCVGTWREKSSACPLCRGDMDKEITKSPHQTCCSIC